MMKNAVLIGADGVEICRIPGLETDSVQLPRTTGRLVWSKSRGDYIPEFAADVYTFETYAENGEAIFRGPSREPINQEAE